MEMIFDAERDIKNIPKVKQKVKQKKKLKQH